MRQRALALAALPLIAASAEACECVVGETLQERIPHYAFVFRAHVVEVTRERNWLGRPTGIMLISLSEILPYRGGPPPFDSLRTSDSGAACGMPIMVPEDYWFFVAANGSLNVCSPSGVASDERLKPLEIENANRVFLLRQSGKAPPPPGA